MVGKQVWVAVGVPWQCSNHSVLVRERRVDWWAE